MKEDIHAVERRFHGAHEHGPEAVGLQVLDGGYQARLAEHVWPGPLNLSYQ
jgi:hypothetical protein